MFKAADTMRSDIVSYCKKRKDDCCIHKEAVAIVVLEKEPQVVAQAVHSEFGP